MTSFLFTFIKAYDIQVLKVLFFLFSFCFFFFLIMRPGHKATDKKTLNFHDTHSCGLQKDTAYRNHNKEAFVFILAP